MTTATATCKRPEADAAGGPPAGAVAPAPPSSTRPAMPKESADTLAIGRAKRKRSSARSEIADLRSLAVRSAESLPRIVRAQETRPFHSAAPSNQRAQLDPPPKARASAPLSGILSIVTFEKVGRVIHASRLTSRQRQILNQLSFPTPAHTQRRILNPVPTG